MSLYVFVKRECANDKHKSTQYEEVKRVTYKDIYLEVTSISQNINIPSLTHILGE